MAAAAGETPFIVLSDENGIIEERIRYAGRIRPEHGLTSEQWDTFVDGVHRIAQAVKMRRDSEPSFIRTVQDT